jgi:hypothetical protein
MSGLAQKLPRKDWMTTTIKETNLLPDLHPTGWFTMNSVIVSPALLRERASLNLVKEENF